MTIYDNLNFHHVNRPSSRPSGSLLIGESHSNPGTPWHVARPWRWPPPRPSRTIGPSMEFFEIRCEHGEFMGFNPLWRNDWFEYFEWNGVREHLAEPWFLPPKKRRCLVQHVNMPFKMFQSNPIVRLENVIQSLVGGTKSKYAFPAR